MIRKIIAEFTSSRVYAMERVFPNEAAQPMPYIRVMLKNQYSLSEFADKMRSGNSAVFVKPEGKYCYLNPMTIFDDEVESLNFKTS